MNKISIIYTTIASQEEAEKLATLAVDENRAACVNIFPNITSIYKWEGKIEKSQEYIMIFKTSESQAQSLHKWLKDNHPYSVPAILSGNVETSEGFYKYINSL